MKKMSKIPSYILSGRESINIFTFYCKRSILSENHIAQTCPKAQASLGSRGCGQGSSVQTHQRCCPGRGPEGTRVL